MRRLLMTAFSTGWLLPMWAAGSTVLGFLQAEAWPLLSGEHPVNSFPFIRFASQSFTVGVVWLAAVIAWWAWRRASLPCVAPGSGEPHGKLDTR